MDSSSSLLSSCIGVTKYGVKYNEFSCIYPSITPYYASFETFYDPMTVMNWMQNNPIVPIMACLLYVFFILVGKVYFRNRKPWQCRKVLAVWNLSLSLFSTIGLIRTLPTLIHNLITMPIRDNLCNDPLPSYGCGSTGLWVQLFVLSKVPELFDTFFIVIHKKPLIFLHWYHHITVLLYCWHSYVTKSPPGIFFVVMNYSVHASMYSYYFIMAIGLKPKWFNPMIITTFQISQMIVGVVVTLAGFYYYKTDPLCKIEAENNTAAFVMYGSYLFLFLQFFIGRYVEPRVTFGKATIPTDTMKKLKTV